MNDSEFDHFLRSHSRKHPGGESPEAPFRREVWQRIEHQRPVSRWQSAFYTLLSRPLRPVAGFACILLTTLAGIWLGSLTGTPTTGPKVDPIATYLASITPTSHRR